MKNNIQDILSHADMEITTLNSILRVVISNLESLNNNCCKSNLENSKELQDQFCLYAEDRINDLYLTFLRVSEDLQEINGVITNIADN